MFSGFKARTGDSARIVAERCGNATHATPPSVPRRLKARAGCRGQERHFFNVPCHSGGVRWINAGTWPRWAFVLFTAMCALGAVSALLDGQWWRLALFLVADAVAFPVIVRERRVRASADPSH
jgi:hypothetical protein